MCYFVTVAVRGDAMPKLLDAVGKPLRAAPVGNRSVLAHLPQGYETFVIVSGPGFCSCELFMAAEDSHRERIEAEARTYREKHRRMGWSTAKIERAMASAAREHSRQDQSFLGLRADVRALLADLAERVGELGVLAHFYSDDVETETCQLTTGPRLNPEQLRSSCVPEHADQIVWVSTRTK